jgi:prefoldin subunit 5
VKLKNEINALRVERGSPELINSYKQQIHGLNERIAALEQEKSDLNSQLLNLRN